MRRIVCLIALTALSSPASARDSYFTFHGHRIHIHVARHCLSLSCIRVSIPGLGSWHRGRERDADVDTTPDPAPAPVQTLPVPAQPRLPPPVIAQVAAPIVTRTPTPAAQPAPVPASTPAAAVPAQMVRPAIKETTASTPSTPPPSVGFDVPRLQPIAAPVKSQATTAAKLDADPRDKSAQKPVVQAPPAAAQLAPKAAPQLARSSDDSDDDFADTPLGDWQTEGKNGLVRIEACGASLCGYVLNAATREKGETVLVNMKPKSDITWSGSIYSRSSGNSYYGTITMKEPNRLHVEACALGKFFCSGNNWTRLEQDRSVRQHELATSRSPSNRS